jgi:predicted tellurium resistance membrane protein TerC
VILAYVGVKMLAVGKPLEWHPPTWLSLAVIAVVLAVSITASALRQRAEQAAPVA